MAPDDSLTIQDWLKSSPSWAIEVFAEILALPGLDAERVDEMRLEDARKIIAEVWGVRGAYEDNAAEWRGDGRQTV